MIASWRSFRFRLVRLLREDMLLVVERERLILPVPVFLKRFAAPAMGLHLGHVILLQAAACLACDGLCGGLRSRRVGLLLCLCHF